MAARKEIFSHGSLVDCPRVQTGEWIRCFGHVSYHTNGDELERKVRDILIKAAGEVIDPFDALCLINVALGNETPAGTATPTERFEALRRKWFDTPYKEEEHAVDTGTKESAGRKNEEVLRRMPALHARAR